MIRPSDARSRGAAVLLPLFDSGLLEQGGSLRSIALLVGLGGVAILALLVAAAAHRNSQSGRSRNTIDDEELFTTTPLPIPKEEMARLKRHSPHHAYSALKLPRWVQVGSLFIALGFTWYVAQRMRPNGSPPIGLDSGRGSSGAAGAGRDDSTETPEDLDLSPDSAPPFSFQARDWVASGAGCEGRLQVTKGASNGWNLTARVHDAQGQFLDSARTRVASLRQGEVVQFTFTRADCERIGAWDVRGDRH